MIPLWFHIFVKAMCFSPLPSLFLSDQLKCCIGELSLRTCCVDTHLTSPRNPYKPHPMFQLNAPVIITADVKKCKQTLPFIAMNFWGCTSLEFRWNIGKVFFFRKQITFFDLVMLLMQTKYTTYRILGDFRVVKFSCVKFFSVSVKPNVRRWQNCMVLSVMKQLSIVSNTRRDWLQGRMDSNSPWGGLPSSGHWAKWSKPPCCLCNSWQFREVLQSWNHLPYINKTFKASPVVLSALQSTYCVYWPAHMSHSQLHPNI